jgi:RNA polymerase sigma-70 factor (ECF subfamily)
MIALLTDDAWLTTPPLPYMYQGQDAIGAFLRGAEDRRGVPLPLASTRATASPLSVPTWRARDEVARPLGLFAITLEGDRISAITWFADTSVLPHFGLPRMLR